MFDVVNIISCSLQLTDFNHCQCHCIPGGGGEGIRGLLPVRVSKSKMTTVRVACERSLGDG